jgi:asparagine synthase (glutamine-hydrolysing)
MCGVAGIAAAEAPADLPDDRSVLAHRGPDGTNTWRWSSPQAAGLLVHTRLAIVDLSHRGSQPMADERGRLVVAFNGEIYNHRELRRRCEARGHRLHGRMDGEVIVHLWEDEGPDCLARLNGIFAVAVVDTATGEVWLARDPLGVKPLYHTVDRTRLWFASEPGALADLGADLGPWDVTALAQFLTFLWIPDPRTPHQRVRSVLPGHVLHWRPDGETTQRRYTAPLHPATESRRIDLATATGELAEHLAAACDRQLLGDVPVAVMASGGLDSSLLWATGRHGLSGAYTIEWPPDSGAERLDEDAATVRALRARLGSPVTFLDGRAAETVPMPPSGDLFADPAYELTRLIAARVRWDGGKVLWSGQGGDELLGGYRRHRVARLLEGAPSRVLGALRGLTRVLGDGATGHEYAARLLRAAAAPEFFARYLHLCTYSEAEERARVLDCSAAEVGDQVVWERHREVYEALPPGLSPLRRALGLDLNVYLPGLGLAYVDRAGMEHGVEIRVPWLDLDLVRWSLELPDRVLAADGGKAPARALSRRVLPRAVAERPKRGFAAPVDRVRRGTDRGGSRGHRQGHYFAHAAHIVGGLTASRQYGRTA